MTRIRRASAGAGSTVSIVYDGDGNGVKKTVLANRMEQSLWCGKGSSRKIEIATADSIVAIMYHLAVVNLRIVTIRSYG